MFFKNLKRLTYGLSALLFLAFSFTACTSSEDNLQAPAKEISLENGIVLPSNIMAEGESFVLTHLAEASEATLVTYRNNYIVGLHLASYDKMGEALANLTSDANISELNLADYLPADQLVNLEALLVSAQPSASERECVPVCYWNGTQWVFAGYYMC